MKLRRMLLAIVCLFGFMFIATPMEANAADAWVYSYNDDRTREHIDSYVITESIKWNSRLTAMQCRVKEVSNGRILKIETYRFVNTRGDWRYETASQTAPVMHLVWPNRAEDKILQLAFNYV